jgi:lipopolysaccharide export LptBFGC system permease protein LptF
VNGQDGGGTHPMTLLWAVAIGALLVASDAWLTAWTNAQRLDRQAEAIAEVKATLAGFE